MVQRLLQYLKIQNPLYYDVKINIYSVANDLLSINNNASMGSLLDINIKVYQPIPIEIYQPIPTKPNLSIHFVDQHMLPANELT